MNEGSGRPLGASVQRELLLRVVICAVLLSALVALISRSVFRGQMEADLVSEVQLAAGILSEKIGDDLEAGSAVTASDIRDAVTSHPAWQDQPKQDGHHIHAVLRTAQGLEFTIFSDTQLLDVEETRELQSIWESFTRRAPGRAARWLSLRGDQVVLIVEPITQGSQGSLGQLQLSFWVEPQTIELMKRRARRISLAAMGITILTAMVIYPLVARLLVRLSRLSERLLASHFEALGVLGGAIAKRDSDTSEHNFRVTLYALRLAEGLGEGRDVRRHLFKGAFLHDVGKIAIPDGILLKPGRLTEEEFEQMKTHVTHGVDILEGSGWLHEGIDVVRHHHEKYDGTGYMDRLQGNTIPLAARIFAVADVFDALTSRRPYKEPMPLDRATQIILEGRGTHFDPKVVDTFELIVERMHRGIASLDKTGLRDAIIGESRDLFSAAQVEGE